MDLNILRIVLMLLIPAVWSSAVMLPDNPLIFNDGPSHLYPTPNAQGVVNGSTSPVTLIGNGKFIFHENCYEDEIAYTTLVSGSKKREENRETVIPITNPAEFVVILDGGRSCNSNADCSMAVQGESNPFLRDECKLRDNFYIGDDGNVQDGRGWNMAPYWYLKGIRNASVSVKFMGTHNSKLPSQSAIRALKSLLVSGVWLGTLSSNYNIVSIRQLTNTDTYLGEELHRNVQEWTGWVNDSVPSSRWEYQWSEPLNFVFRREWNAADPLRNFERIVTPVRYVLLNNVLDRCCSRKDCILQLQTLQRTQREDFGDLLDNFYIGEDGNVYEGRGWDVLPHWHIEGFGNTYVSVSFLGSFQTELPSYRSIAAFKALVSMGIQLGKLSADFKLSSLRNIYDDSALLGDALKNYVEDWTPWDKTFDRMSLVQRTDAKLVPLMTREGQVFDTRRNNLLILHPEVPVKYVILNQGGQCCLNATECTALMLSEKRRYSSNYGDLLDNFYVGCDGMVYEGQGWKFLPPIHLKHARNSYITVKFFGTFNVTKPNDLALLAFNSFIKLGIGLGKISPSYQLYSYRHIYNDSSFLGDALSEYVEGLERWSTAMNEEGRKEGESLQLSPFVCRDDWNATSLSGTLKKINGSVRYVIVGEIGDRCFSYDRCLHQIQNENDRVFKLYGSLTDHFYIGDDGNVYEGLGWVSDTSDTDNNTQEYAVSIRFFGKFENVLPSPLAMAAFHWLLNSGLDTKILSENYTIITYCQIYNCTNDFHQDFKQVIEKWNIHSNDSTSLSITDSLTFAPLMIVPRSRRGHRRRGKPSRAYYGKKGIPAAEYVVISDGGDRCSHHEECLNQSYHLSTNSYENFFVGEDGRSYEASGWSLNIHGEYFCNNCTMVFIKFMGKFNYDMPSLGAIRAMNYLINLGIRSGKIIPDYKLISIHHLCNNCSLIGDFLNTGLRSWRNWSKNTNVSADCWPFTSKILYRQEWNRYLRMVPQELSAFLKSYPFPSITVEPVNYNCEETVGFDNWLQSRRDSTLAYNFIIGCDVSVYEALGWQWVRPSNRNSNSLMTLRVFFMVNLERQISRQRAIFAFKKFIVKTGIQQGYLEPSFKLHGNLAGEYGDLVFENLMLI